MPRLEVSMSGRFGKYGDAKRKAQFWKNGFQRKNSSGGE